MPKSVFVLTLLLSLSVLSRPAEAAVPQLRMKLGFSSLTVNADKQVVNQSLNPMLTLMPSLLWEVPAFSARLGVHYLQEMSSNYGMTPLQGIGISGYYYFYGVSSSYQNDQEGTVIEKSKPGPYLIGALTPANFNMNKLDTTNTSSNFHFSAFIYDITTGIGYDYPINRNMVLAVEYVLRNGSGADGTTATVNYKGSSIFISFATSYF